MVFADVGDRLRLEPGRGFAVEGPFAAELAGLARGANLVDARRGRDRRRAADGWCWRRAAGGQRPRRRIVGCAARPCGCCAPPSPTPSCEAAAGALGSDGVPCLWAGL